MISKLDFVGIPTRDPECSRRFYGEVLGLRADPHGNDLMLHHRYAPSD